MRSRNTGFGRDIPNLVLEDRYMTNKFGKLLEEDLLQTPAPHILVVAFKEGSEAICSCSVVEAIDVVESEWPAKFEVLAIVDGEVCSAKVVVVMTD